MQNLKKINLSDFISLPSAKKLKLEANVFYKSCSGCFFNQKYNFFNLKSYFSLPVEFFFASMECGNMEGFL